MTDESLVTEATPAQPRPLWSLTTLATIVAVQSVGLLAYGIYLLVQGLVGHPVSIAQAESVGAIVVFFALGLLLVPYGLIRARSWSRTPTVMLEVLSFVLVYDLWHAHVYWLAVIAALIAVGALYLVFQPAVTRTLYDAASRRPAVPVERQAAPSGEAADTTATKVPDARRVEATKKAAARAASTPGKRR
jgi:hypothetical protein